MFFLLFSSLLFYLCTSLCDAFFISLLLFYVSKFNIKKALFVSFLMNFFFFEIWMRDAKVRSFFLCPACAFFPSIFSLAFSTFRQRL